MKKISIIALVLVLTAGLMTACRRPSTDETTSPVETNPVMTTPSSESTMPTTMPQPSTAMTDPMDDMTLPDITDGLDGTNGLDSTNGTDNTESSDPTDNSAGARRRRLPRY